VRAVSRRTLFAFATPDIIYSRVPRTEYGDHPFECVMMVSTDIQTYELAHSIVSFIIPFMILFVLNSAIAVSFCRRKTIGQQIRSTRRKGTDDRNVIVMVMAVTIHIYSLCYPTFFILFFMLIESVIGIAVDPERVRKGHCHTVL
jgi:TctA family transporter